MAGLYYQETMDKRHQTPESFRTGRVTEEPDPPETPPTAYERRREQEIGIARESREQQQHADRDGSQPRDSRMSNPYLDPGFSQPYQISQNRYRQQVFGSSQPKVMEHEARGDQSIPSRPNPVRLPQRPWSDIPIGLKKYREQRQDGYDMSPRRHDGGGGYDASPRRHDGTYEMSPRRMEGYNRAPQGHPEVFYDDRTYRSGRPDLGPQKVTSVPYPQEPLNRRKQDNYVQPAAIGHGHHGTEDQPKPHPGWLILMRFHKDGGDQVQRALFMCQKHIEADGGRILGLARSYGVKIREGGDNWVTFGRMRHIGGGVWNPQESPMQDDTHYNVLAIYYPSLSRAKQWWDRDVNFKQKDFPRPHACDCVALPLSSSVDTNFSKTLVLSMYPKISHAEYFRDKFSVPTEEMMMKRFRATPYVIKTTYYPVDDSRQRVATHLRGCWLPRNSIVTLSMFDSIQESFRYFSDPEYYEAKKYQDRVSAPTTVICDLDDWHNSPSWGAR